MWFGISIASELQLSSTVGGLWGCCQPWHLNCWASSILTWADLHPLSRLLHYQRWLASRHPHNCFSEYLIRDRGHLRSHTYCHNILGEVVNHSLMYAMHNGTDCFFFSLQWSCKRKTVMIWRGCSVVHCAVYFCCQALMYLCGWL